MKKVGKWETFRFSTFPPKMRNFFNKKEAKYMENRPYSGKNPYFTYETKTKEKLSNGCIVESFELRRLTFDMSKLSYCFFCKERKVCEYEDGKFIGICDDFLEDVNVASGILLYKP